MLRPATTDPMVLNARREQDKVFGLLLTLNPVFNDLIKHILREDKLPSLEEVCARIQKEQGSSGLFGGKGELLTANKGTYKPEEKKPWVCEYCKKKGHTKDKCWILHPHLKPAKFKDSRANTAYEHSAFQSHAGSSTHREETIQGDFVRIADLEAVIKAIASLKESGY
ncbi:uncharacterized protein LOC112084669 [Eutrema salsugineum]|uniref:uncharacterized protein LOC112084669 n=1 Tax=Eutrema salsugineum TaxID=72664 RepID=UPI000CECF255|nr:uncharacterized protein LOC112084669 [Eutrema salsugineum]